MGENYGIKQIKTLAIGVLLILLFMALIVWLFITEIQEEPETCTCKKCGVVKFMDKYSMDWDYEDSNNLLKISEVEVEKYGNKTPLNYSRAILVTLNRVFNENYPDTIYDVCIQAAEEIGLSEEDFCSTIITEESKYSMDVILYDKFDDTNGSCSYEEVLK